MNIALIDDSTEERVLLRKILEQASEKLDISSHISEYASADSFLDIFEPEYYDLCFMDICMEGTNGMDAVRRIRTADKDCLIVFMTNSPDYVYEGYEVSAFRYLLKPANPETIRQILSLSAERSCKNRKRLAVSIGKKTLEIPYGRIHYVISAGKSVDLHLDGEVLSLSARHTFSRTVAPLLQDPRFLTCGRGIVVNLRCIKELLRDSFLMKNGDLVPISRRLYPSVSGAYMDYQFDCL